MTENEGSPEESTPSSPPPVAPTAEQPGYWEQQAASTPPPPPTPGVQLNPQSGYPADPGPAYPQQPQQPQQPYGQPQYADPQYAQPQYAQPQYAQPQYAQPPYGQPQYGQPQYAQPQYGQPAYGYQQPYYSYTAPQHPKSVTALVLGLIGTVGALAVCGIPLVVAPFAWVVGYKARKEIRESNGQFTGDGQAKAGMILGIVGTVLLVIALLIGVLVLIAYIDDPTIFDNSSTV